MVQPVTDSSAPRRFDGTVLSVTSHRPWPMPRSPWGMTQTWLDLLFAHWRVDVLRLRRLVPEPLEIDTFDGKRGWGSSRSAWPTSRHEEFRRPRLATKGGVIQPRPRGRAVTAFAL